MAPSESHRGTGRGDRSNFRGSNDRNRSGTGNRNPGSRGSGPRESGYRGSNPRSSDDRSHRGGVSRHIDEPKLADDIDPRDLDGAVRRSLLSLDKGNAETVAKHLIAAGRALDDDPEAALAHARAARNRAGRIAAVREACGIAAYTCGEWAEALSELRAAKRMSGAADLLPLIADCERGLGRPEKAVELARGDDARQLSGDAVTELRIVEAGARMDLKEFDKAVVTLQAENLDPARRGFEATRLFYAYAEALLAAGRTGDALIWFLNTAAADDDGLTDAELRVTELS